MKKFSTNLLKSKEGLKLVNNAVINNLKIDLESNLIKDKLKLKELHKVKKSLLEMHKINENSLNENDYDDNKAEIKSKENEFSHLLGKKYSDDKLAINERDNLIKETFKYVMNNNDNTIQINELNKSKIYDYSILPIDLNKLHVVFNISNKVIDYKCSYIKGSTIEEVRNEKIRITNDENSHDIIKNLSLELIHNSVNFLKTYKIHDQNNESKQLHICDLQDNPLNLINTVVNTLQINLEKVYIEFCSFINKEMMNNFWKIKSFENNEEIRSQNYINQYNLVQKLNSKTSVIIECLENVMSFFILMNAFCPISFKIIDNNFTNSVKERLLVCKTSLENINFELLTSENLNRLLPVISFFNFFMNLNDSFTEDFILSYKKDLICNQNNNGLIKLSLLINSFENYSLESKLQLIYKFRDLYFIGNTNDKITNLTKILQLNYNLFNENHNPIFENNQIHPIDDLYVLKKYISNAKDKQGLSEIEEKINKLFSKDIKSNNNEVDELSDIEIQKLISLVEENDEEIKMKLEKNQNYLIENPLFQKNLDILHRMNVKIKSLNESIKKYNKLNIQVEEFLDYFTTLDFDINEEIEFSKIEKLLSVLLLVERKFSNWQKVETIIFNFVLANKESIRKYEFPLELINYCELFSDDNKRNAYITCVLNNIKVLNNNYSFDYLYTLLKFYSKKEYFNSQISDKIFEFIKFNIENSVFNEKICKYYSKTTLTELNECSFKVSNDREFISLNIIYEPVIFTIINYLNKTNKNHYMFDTKKFVKINEITNFSSKNYEDFLKTILNSNLISSLNKSLNIKRTELNTYYKEKLQLSELKNEFYIEILQYIEFFTSLISSCIENEINLNSSIIQDFLKIVRSVEREFNLSKILSFECLVRVLYIFSYNNYNKRILVENNHYDFNLVLKYLKMPVFSKLNLSSAILKPYFLTICRQLEMSCNLNEKEVFNKLQSISHNMVVDVYSKNFISKGNMIGIFAFSNIFLPLNSINDFKHNKDIHIVFTKSNKKLSYSRKIELSYIKYIEDTISQKACIIYINESKIRDEESLYEMIMEEMSLKIKSEEKKQINFRSTETMLEEISKIFKNEENDKEEDNSITSKNQKITNNKIDGNRNSKEKLKNKNI